MDRAHFFGMVRGSSQDYDEQISSAYSLFHNKREKSVEQKNYTPI